jgi:RHS repeat-associated protein
MSNCHTIHHRLLSILFTGGTIIALIIGSAQAQSVQPGQAKKPTAPAQQSKTLTPENLEKESYQLWLACFQTWKQGKKPDVPNLGIFNSVDPKEAQRAHAVWEQSKLRAFLAVEEKAMYQECLNWWQAKEQGQQMTAPILKYPDVFDETQVKRIEAVWQQAYDKAHLTIFEQGAYQTWLDYYQSLQQGGQPPLPELAVTDGIKSQEAKKAQEVWTQAQARAQREVQQRSGQAQSRQAKQPSISANNVAALSDGEMTDSLPDVMIDDATRQKAAQSIMPLLDVPTSPNSYPQPIAGFNQVGFNQPRGIAGVFSYTGNSAQPSQMQPNSPEVVTANNNRILVEMNAETMKAKKAVNTETAKQLVEQLDSKNGQTNITPATSGGPQLVRRYTYGLQGPISMSQLINGQWVTSYFIYDGEGNVRALTDPTGNVTDTFDYDAFGNLINRTGNTPNTRFFHGEEFDPDLGLYNLRARLMNQDTGRFFTADTFENSQFDRLNRHKYIYASNNPINIADPSGKFGIAEASGEDFFRGVLDVIPVPNFGATISAVGNSADQETLKLNIVYEDIVQNGTRISYSDSEKIDIENSFVYFANYGYGNIDIKFKLTETDGAATNLYNINRQISKGYVGGSLNAFFTKRGDPGPSPGVTTDNGSFINSKSDVKNLLHELTHQIGIRTNVHGYSMYEAEFGRYGVIAVERALLSGRQDYNLPPRDTNIFYKLRLWGADYAAYPLYPVK